MINSLIESCGVHLTWLDCNRGNFSDLLSTNVFGKMYGDQSRGYVDMIGAERVLKKMGLTKG